MLKKDIIWPSSRRYKSKTDFEPIGFFSDCLCNSKQFDLLLGFFSSTAINVLSCGFSSFLYNGGKLRLIVNDILTEDDRKTIQLAESDETLPYFDILNIAKLHDTLSGRDKHFFECLAWLIRNGKIEIKIVSPKFSEGISHTKCGIFYDEENHVGFDGSCNFSRTALVENIESIRVSCEWDGEIAKTNIEELKKEFDDIFNESDPTYNYLDSGTIKEQFTQYFENKSLDELITEESKYINEELITKDLPTSIAQVLNRAKDAVDTIIQKQELELNEPRFPFITGPKDYQERALNNWISNGQQGLFAMATGTGKTITALNCLLRIYEKCGYYKSIILVPTIALVDQWEKECQRFNFKNIIKICSKNSDWKDSIGRYRILERSNPKESYVIICTYASFGGSKVFGELNTFPANKLLLIADEAHNMGANQIRSRLKDIVYKRRIGLSATPFRQYDTEGNEELEAFFRCKEKYTFEYSMEEAIHSGALCKYYYYPHVVNLTSDEMEEYVKISQQIVKTLGYEDEEAEKRRTKLLLIRKSIIHKAENKKFVFKKILEEHYKKYHRLNYTLIYVPEGNIPDKDGDVFCSSDSLKDDIDTTHIINEYTEIVKNIDRHIVVRKFTSESKDRDEMIDAFAKGDIDVLTSMKCLDEGVDVPRSELAIFCASTGNPRQFIQRRGRVLRTHKDKQFAIIHDLVVAPEISKNSECYQLERNLISGELKRVRDFALLSENLNFSINELENILEHYNLSLFS